MGIWFLVAAGHCCQVLMASRSLVEGVLPSPPRIACCPALPCSVPLHSRWQMPLALHLPEPLPCRLLPLLTPGAGRSDSPLQESQSFLFEKGLLAHSQTCAPSWAGRPSQGLVTEKHDSPSSSHSPAGQRRPLSRQRHNHAMPYTGQGHTKVSLWSFVLGSPQSSCPPHPTHGPVAFSSCERINTRFSTLISVCSPRSPSY